MAPHFSNLLETAIFPALIMTEKVNASSVVHVLFADVYARPVFSTSDQISRQYVSH